MIKKPKDVTTLLGASAVLEVVISEDNIPVRWMFNQVELKANDDYKMVSEKKSHKLIVQNVDKSKEGEYTAMVGHLQTSACLIVEGECWSSVRASIGLSVRLPTCWRYLPSALRVTRPLKSIAVPETHPATFECEVSHLNAPAVWLKDGVEVEMSDKIGIEVSGKVHQLKVMNTSKEDGGEYAFICGSDRVSAALTISCKSASRLTKTATMIQLKKPDLISQSMKEVATKDSM